MVRADVVLPTPPFELANTIVGIFSFQNTKPGKRQARTYSLFVLYPEKHCSLPCRTIDFVKASTP